MHAQTRLLNLAGSHWEDFKNSIADTVVPRKGALIAGLPRRVATRAPSTRT